MSAEGMSAEEEKARADDAPRGRPVLRHGVDPFPILATLSAQLDALAATLTVLAGCFTLAAPPPDAAATAPKKAPPRTFGHRSPPPE